MNKFILEEIMKLKPNDEIGCMSSINILSKYTLVDLKTNEYHELFYQALVPQLLLSNITEEEVIDVRNAGWELSDNKLLLIKKI